MEHDFIKKISYILLIISFVNIGMCIIDYIMVECNSWLSTVLILQIVNIIFLLILPRIPYINKKRLLIIFSTAIVIITFFIPVMKLQLYRTKVDRDGFMFYTSKEIIGEKNFNIYFISIEK